MFISLNIYISALFKSQIPSATSYLVLNNKNVTNTRNSIAQIKYRNTPYIYIYMYISSYSPTERYPNFRYLFLRICGMINRARGNKRTDVTN